MPLRVRSFAPLRADAGGRLERRGGPASRLSFRPLSGLAEVDDTRAIVRDEKGATVRVQSEEKLEPGPAYLALAPAGGRARLIAAQRAP